MIPNAVKALLSRDPYRSIKLTVRDVVMLHLISHGMVIFRKWNLGRDLIYILIGDRGSGKSLSGGMVCLRDYMMVGEPVWSNLRVVAKLPCGDAIEVLLREYEDFTGQEIERAPVIYQSEELAPAKLLSKNPPYKGGMIFVDEVNIELADALRATMNQALASSDTVQLLRKMLSGLTGTCISEMFLPPRIREAVDVYIRVHDYAFINSSDRYGQRQGVDQELAIYPVTGKLAGYDNRFSETKQAWQTIRLHGKSLWKIVDTYDRRERHKHVTRSLYADEEEYNEEQEAEAPLSETEVQIEQSEMIKADHANWDWMYNHPFIRKMIETGAEVTEAELMDKLAPDAPEHVTGSEVLDHFIHYLNPMKRRSNSRYHYHFDAFTRRELAGKQSQELASALA